MGDRYFWTEPCPQCGKPVDCYYAESCDMTDAHCYACGKTWQLAMHLGIVPVDEDRDETRQEYCQECHKPVTGEVLFCSSACAEKYMEDMRLYYGK